MDVTREDVLRCAKLAALSLREDEIEPMRAAMSQLLSHAERLNELALDDVEPMTHGLPIQLPRRKDEAHPWFTSAEALANAPEQAEGHFVVPKVL
ncbi:MAG TPA: Asp-tRNA(Asn)/Glu-tRNA(Gln) amidotransferase subunit GatC [Holophaga sp.]|jgi:aspartyl-tRNA(Asn)/glutamyl-tRNA(Gln) amidotransferase subunit C|nr:Asp-tRNA(Asn)/Glu-tRNA(Gln) amidotransferase subunit GatC [Holophaga sp.]